MIIINILFGVILMSSYAFSSALYKYEEMDLSNGLKVVAIPMNNNSSVVDINVFYKVGSRNEIMGKSGIAHMLEHMNFKSTKNLKSGEFDNIVKRFGGNTNASTSFDYTRYYVKSNKDNLDKSLELFAEMMNNLSLKNDEFQTEREVVSEERLWRTDNSPMGNLYFRLFNTAFMYHPYHWTPIGFMSDIRSWNIEDIRDFYKTYYQPKNAIILVAGDINAKKVFDSAKKYFDGIKNTKEIPTIHTIEPKQTDKRFVDIKREDQEVELYALAYKIPNFEHEDQNALSALSYILSGGKSSILVDNLVNQEKIAQSVQAYNMDLKDESLFIIMAMGNKDIKAERLESSILAQLDNIKEGKIHKDELDKVKINIKADFIFGLQNSSQVASLYGSYFARGNIKPLLEYEESFDKLNIDDVIKVANKYFRSESSTTLFLRK